jgi:hypothetical protein
MSLYQLHRAIWDQLHAAETSTYPGRSFDARRYDLTSDERAAFDDRNIASLYRLGLHPLLLNAFCRATGVSSQACREQLQVFAVPETRTARWQR